MKKLLIKGTLVGIMLLLSTAAYATSLGKGYNVENYTGTTATAVTLSMPVLAEIETVRIHTSAASTGTLTIGTGSVVGAAYSLTLNSQSMNGLTDYVWQPTRPVILRAGDAIKVTWANSTSRTWGLEIIYKDR